MQIETDYKYIKNKIIENEKLNKIISDLKNDLGKKDNVVSIYFINFLDLCKNKKTDIVAPQSNIFILC